jgi:hypothetical protein
MIDLRQKNVDNSYFEKYYSTAAKDVVSAVYYEKDRLFIADWKSNLYCIDTATNTKKWEVKLKNPILFEFIPFNQKLYALSENTLFEIDGATGHVEEKIHFVLIGSVVHCQHIIYLNERSKKGPKTTGRILQVDLKDFLVTTIKEEQQKSTFGMLTKKKLLLLVTIYFFTAIRPYISTMFQIVQCKRYMKIIRSKVDYRPSINWARDYCLCLE